MFFAGNAAGQNTALSNRNSVTPGPYSRWNLQSLWPGIKNGAEDVLLGHTTTPGGSLPSPGTVGGSLKLSNASFTTDFERGTMGLNCAFVAGRYRRR